MDVSPFDVSLDEYAPAMGRIRVFSHPISVQLVAGDEGRAKPAKICMITLSHSPWDDRLYWKEARSLLKSYDVCMISARKSDVSVGQQELSVIAVERKRGVVGWLSALFSLFKEGMRVNADIYQAIEPETVLVGLFVKALKRKRLTVDVHESYEDVIPLAHGLYKLFLMAYVNLLEPLLLRFADGVVCADGEIVKRLSRFNRNICAVFNYPCLDLFTFTELASDNIVIYVGQMTEERGILQLIQAIKEVAVKVPSVKLTLLPPYVDPSFRAKVKEAVKGAEANFELVEGVPHTAVRDYIAGSRIGAVLLQPIPKFHKNIPVKMWEYMACGRPVVGSDLPPIRRYVEKANCGVIVDPTSPKAIAEAILTLLQDPDLATEFGRRGRMAVETSWNWAESERVLLEFYREVLRK